MAVVMDRPLYHLAEEAATTVVAEGKHCSIWRLCQSVPALKSLMCPYLVIS